MKNFIEVPYMGRRMLINIKNISVIKDSVSYTLIYVVGVTGDLETPFTIEESYASVLEKISVALK